MTSPDESAKASALAQALLAPRSVAIVGQSDDAAKTAGDPAKPTVSGEFSLVGPKLRETLRRTSLLMRQFDAA